MTKRAPRKGEGRPSIFTKELGESICARIASGESLRKICRDDDMPDRDTIHRWLLDKNKKEFYDQYEVACNTRAENMFDELNEIADVSDSTESPMRSRLRVDTRKWYLSKVLPKKYGDKQILAGPDDGPVQITVIKYANGDNPPV